MKQCTIRSEGPGKWSSDLLFAVLGLPPYLWNRWSWKLQIWHADWPQNTL